MFHCDIVFKVLLLGLVRVSVQRNSNCYAQFDNKVYKPHPDMHLTTDEVIRKYGYFVETHTGVTDDGYILTVFRIPGSPRSPPSRNKSAVYLNHGLFSNGQVWLLQHGPKNLAFKLADENFDVWIANGRGTSYSQKHINSTLTTDGLPYWNFTWHEMGVHDISAVVDLIRNVTGQEKIYYVGHSMGATSFFVAMSEIPSLNDYIATAVLYAPVAFVNNSKSIGRHFAPFAEDLYILLRDIYGGKLNGLKILEENFFDQPIGEICSFSAMACGICSEINAMMFGDDPLQTNYTLLPLFFSLYPETVSSKTLVHYAQLMTSGEFRKYDYGSELENEIMYGSGHTTPPHYNLSKITSPMVLFWSENDDLATPIDVSRTASKLNPKFVKENNKVEWDQWTHRDFIKGIDADKFLYDRTVEIFKYKLYG